MNITILNLTVGDEKTNRLLAFLDGEEIHWTTQPVLPQAHVSSSGDNNCYEDDEEDDDQVLDDINGIDGMILAE